MKLKSIKPWHLNSTVSLPFVGVVQVDGEGYFEVKDAEQAQKLIESSIGIETASKVEPIKNKTQQSRSLDEEDVVDQIGNHSDDTTSVEEVQATVEAMSLERLKQFAEEQGLPKNKWQRMGEAKLKEYILNEMGL